MTTYESGLVFGPVFRLCERIREESEERCETGHLVPQGVKGRFTQRTRYPSTTRQCSLASVPGELCQYAPDNLVYKPDLVCGHDRLYEPGPGTSRGASAFRADVGIRG